MFLLSFFIIQSYFLGHSSSRSFQAKQYIMSAIVIFLAVLLLLIQKQGLLMGFQMSQKVSTNWHGLPRVAKECKGQPRAFKAYNCLQRVIKCYQVLSWVTHVSKGHQDSPKFAKDCKDCRRLTGVALGHKRFHRPSQLTKYCHLGSIRAAKFLNG